MNPMNYGAASMAHLKSENAMKIKEKKAALNLICNRVKDACLQTQCQHKKPHEYQGADCNRHQCQRDQHQTIVDCVVCDGE